MKYEYLFKLFIPYQCEQAALTQEEECCVSTRQESAV